MSWFNFLKIYLLETTIEPDSEDEFQYTEVLVDEEYSTSGIYINLFCESLLFLM